MGGRDLSLMLVIQSVLEWEDPCGIFVASSGDHSEGGLDAKEVTHGQLSFHDMA